MDVRVVTIEREFGCGGADIARLLADRLGWTLWDQHLTNEIARLARCDRKEVACREERVAPLHHRVLHSFMRGSFEGSLNLPRLNLVDTDTIVSLTKRIVLNVADEGRCVIVGRGSPFFLANRPDAFHVFVYAPYEDKVRRVSKRGVSPDEAARLVETVDGERADFVRKHFERDWPCRSLYHLMVNTRSGNEWVAQTILHSIAIHQEQVAP